MSQITLLFVYHAIDLIPIFFFSFLFATEDPRNYGTNYFGEMGEKYWPARQKWLKMTNWELCFNTLVDDCGMIKKSFLPPEAEIREQRNYTKKAIVMPTQFTAVKIQPHCEGVYL